MATEYERVRFEVIGHPRVVVDLVSNRDVENVGPASWEGIRILRDDDEIRAILTGDE